RLGRRGAARAFGPQTGASPEAVEELERRLEGMAELAPFANLPGAGAAGGLGAAFAALGAVLVPGAELVLDLVGFRERVRSASLAVTGEGTIDRTSSEGKAPGEVVRVCLAEGVRCAVFGGVVAGSIDGAELYELSGDPAARSGGSRRARRATGGDRPLGGASETAFAGRVVMLVPRQG